MKNVLFTAFKGKTNSSFQLVKQMNTEKIFLTNSFQGIVRDIGMIKDQYQIIIMFGLDKSLQDSVRFEIAAEKDEDYILTSAKMADYTMLADKLDLCYTISNIPTHYLCNEAYYYMMKKVSCPTIFIHIPTMKNMSKEFFRKLTLYVNKCL